MATTTADRPATGGFLERLKVRSKILLAMVALAAVSIGVSALSLERMHQLNGSLHDMRADNVASLSTIADARHAQATMAQGTTYAMAATAMPEERAAGIALVKQGAGRMDAALAALSHGHEGEEAGHAESADEGGSADAGAAWERLELMLSVVVLGEQPPAGVTVAGDSADFTRAVGEFDAALTALAEAENARAAATADEGQQAYENARLIVIGSLVVGLALALGLAMLIANRIVRPLREVSDVVRAMAEGDLTRTVDVRSADEVGTMAAGVNRAVASVREAISTLAHNADLLTASSDRLSSSGDEIMGSAREASGQAAQAATAADQVSRNVRTVSDGAGQMGDSIREIASNANEGARVASRAVTVAAGTNDTVAKLGESSTEIGNVVKMITSIAEQTNLLALNATIEAARAGEAGKGFAVVASEVKDLAQETAKATEDIARRVAAIQSDTESAVGAIGEISEIIAQINDFQTTIAAAVEEQTATTAEMNRNVGEAASGSAAIADNISQVAGATGRTTEGVEANREASDELVRMAAELRAVVSRFHY